MGVSKKSLKQEQLRVRIVESKNSGNPTPGSKAAPGGSSSCRTCRTDDDDDDDGGGGDGDGDGNGGGDGNGNSDGDDYGEDNDDDVDDGINRGNVDDS